MTPGPPLLFLPARDARRELEELVARVNASYLRDPQRARERHDRTTGYLRRRVLEELAR